MRSFIITLLFSAITLHGQEPEEKLIPTAVKSVIGHGDSVALSIGIISGGNVEIFHAGEVTLGKGQLPDSQTVYEIGSITKVFTALMLAQEVSQNKLKLDAPVSSLLPVDFEVPTHGEHTIRLNHLSTHSSGLARLPSNLYEGKAVDPLNPYAHFGSEQLKESLKKAKLSIEPGSAPSGYSNYAVGLLGYALASNRKMTYPKLLEKTLLAPLGMKSTTAELARNTTHLKRARGYDLVHNDHHYWDFDSLAGAGGIDSNLDDMLKFAQFCLSPIDSPLQPALELTMKPQIKTRGKGAQCLGWILAADGNTYLHNGMTGGFSSFIAFNRKHNIAVCILSSGTSPHISGLGEHLVRCAASGKPAAYEIKKAFTPTKEQLNELVGNYELSIGKIFTIKTRNNRLFAKLTGQPYMEVIATSPTEFNYLAIKARLKFTPGKSLTLFQNGLELIAKKTP